METKTKVIIATASLATAFAVGRYTVPTKIVTETKVVEVEKKVEVVKETKDKDKRKKTKKVIKIAPNGEKIITEVTVEDTKTTKSKDSSVTDEKSKASDSKTTQEKSNSPTTISILAGKKITDGLDPILFGAHVSKPVLGPVSIGVWGLSNMTFGLSVGLSF